MNEINSSKSTNSTQLHNSIKIEDEKNFKESERKKYKEDLDYLVSIKRKKDDLAKYVKNQEKNDFNYNSSMLKNEEDSRSNQSINLRKILMMNNIEKMSNNRENNSKSKILKLEEEKHFLEYIEKLKQFENIRNDEEKNVLKNYKIVEYQNFIKNKQVKISILTLKKIQLDRKYDERKENNLLLEEQNRKTLERENEYKSKINKMNNKIFENVDKYHRYINSSPEKELSQLLDLHTNQQDLYLNKKLAEKKNFDSAKINSQALTERLKQEENYKELVSKVKFDKEENKKLYKNFLDYQMIEKKEKLAKSPKNEGNMTILPSYFTVNRPIPIYKKAADTINLIKNYQKFENSIDSLNNKGNFSKNNNIASWETKLNHNPITHPLMDINYNKYLGKSVSQKKQVEIEENSNLFRNAANSIIN